MPKKKNKKLIPVLIHIPESWKKDLDLLVAVKMYANRNEAIRMAIRDLLSDEVWKHRRRRPLFRHHQLPFSKDERYDKQHIA